MVQNSPAKSVNVFCASGDMAPEFKRIAHKLGFELAKNGYTLITGGTTIGMMCQVIDGHAAGDATAMRHGVIPKIFRDSQSRHPAILPENITWTEDMHAGLKSFYALADNIVVLPGGLGTLQELIDCLVHIQLELMRKKVFLFNINSYWDNILKQFQVMVQQNTVNQKDIDNLVVVNSIPELIQHLS